MVVRRSALFVSSLQGEHTVDTMISLGPLLKDFKQAYSNCMSIGNLN